jgi:hypothetical protein
MRTWRANNKYTKEIIRVIDTLPVKERDGRAMKSKRRWTKHKSHESTTGECIKIATRSTKTTFTVTVVIVMRKNDFM